VAGAGVSGSAGAAALGFEGAAAGAVNCPSRTDLGVRERVDMSCSTKERSRKIPVPPQEILVSRFPAWRIPMNASGEELAPPKLAERPWPLPLCRRMAATTTRLVRIRRTSRKVYISAL
jgi:hypothetical protein